MPGKTKAANCADDEYEVEKIVACNSSETPEEATMFLVKWKGYPASQNTWEPLSHLSCPDVLEEFKAQWNLSPCKRNPTATSEGVTHPRARTDTITELAVADGAGAAYGPEPEALLGIHRDCGGEEFVVVKWKATGVITTEPCSVFGLKYTRMLVDYFKEHSHYHYT